MYESSIVLLLGITAKVAQGYVTCSGPGGSKTQCYGSGAYCCGLYQEECCWGDVYSFWWFWFIWFLVVVFIVACSICICVRRRRRYAAQPRYVIVDSQATYGTMPYRENFSNQYTSVGTAAGPTMPPSAPAYQEKPPDYSTIAGQRV